MAVLKDSDKEQLRQAFGRIAEPVRLVLFTQEMECDFCEVTHELLSEVADLSDRIALEVHDFVKDAALAETYGVDKIPAVLVEGKADRRVRFFGAPGGYEFTSLVEDIIDVSSGQHGLQAPVLEELAKVDQPVHMQVMVTPT